MPIAYKEIKYGCQFKCGSRRKKSISEVERHENICWHNPENKTCKTCKHEIYESDNCPHPELDGCPVEYWINRGCNIPEGGNHIQEIYESLKVSDSIHIKPVLNCKFWEGINKR